MKRDDRFDPPIASKSDHLKDAWRALEDGAADKTQGRMILDHLASLTGYYTDISLAQWIKDTGSPQGFDVACIEDAARRRVFGQIVPYLSEQPDRRFA